MLKSHSVTQWPSPEAGCCEQCPAVWSLRLALWAQPAAHIPAVWCGAPAAVGVGHQPAPQHELLVFLHQDVVAEDEADVVGVEALRALRAADVHSALRDLYTQVLAQAVHAGAVVAGHDLGEPVLGVPQEAQGALQEVSAGLAAGDGAVVGGGTGGEDGVLVRAHLRVDALNARNAIHTPIQLPRLALSVLFPVEERAQGNSSLLGGLLHRGQAHRGG